MHAPAAQWNAWLDSHICTFANKNLLTLPCMLYNSLSQAESLAQKTAFSSDAHVELVSMRTPCIMIGAVKG